MKVFFTCALAALAFSIPAQAQDDYKLVWQDEFNGTSVNTDAWNIETGPRYNNEMQYYKTDNVWEGDGNLVLTPKWENYGGKSFTSGRVNTQHRVHFTYGRIDARITMPLTYKGSWPAWWMLGEDSETNAWPGCGEIDFIELGNYNGYPENGNDPTKFFPATIHWYQQGNMGYGEGHGMKYINTTAAKVEGNGSHLFTCIWDANSIKMYVDLDKNPNVAPYATFTRDEVGAYYWDKTFRKDYYLILNLAVGGDFTSIFDPSGITAKLGPEGAMYVDYVRIYQKNGQTGTFPGKVSDKGKTPAQMEGGGSTPTTSDDSNNTTDNSHNSYSGIISLYSDLYPNVGKGSTWNNWGGSNTKENFYEITISDGNKAAGVNNITYGGYNINSDWSSIDASGAKFLHVDIFSYDNNGIDVGLTSKGVRGDGSDNATGYLHVNLVPGWNSFDFPIEDIKTSARNNGMNFDLSKLIQFSWQNGTGYSTLLFDNIYLSKDSNYAKANNNNTSTGINSITQDIAENNRNLSGNWYRLDGSRVHGNPTTAGIYIHNGRKIALK